MAAADEEEEEVDGLDLTEPAMKLSQVDKTIDGSGFAYVQLDCVGKGVGSIAVLENYGYLRQIDLSQNCIVNVEPLAKLGHVLRLSLASNRIESIASWGPSVLCHLLSLDMSDNRLKALPRLYLPSLKQVSFARNQIVKCTDFRGHKRLKAMDLSGNRRLDSVTGVKDMPALETLSLAAGALPGLGGQGLRALPSLKFLDISQNGLETLEGPWEETPALQHLSANENRLASAMAFEPISRLPQLRKVQIKGNPIEDEAEPDQVRLEVIICHRQIAEIDDVEVEEEERDQAENLYQERIEAEREKQRAEEAAKAEAEAEGAGEEEEDA